MKTWKRFICLLLGHKGCAFRNICTTSGATLDANFWVSSMTFEGKIYKWKHGICERCGAIYLTHYGVCKEEEST